MTYAKLFRFDTTKRPARNYFSRREQWRLLLLVLSLGVVMLAMRQVRQPEAADRFAQVFSEPAASTATDRDQEIEPGMPSVEVEIPGDLRRMALEVVRDNTYFRNAETPSWFGLISRLQNSTQDELSSSSIGEVTYAQLVDQPRSYRAEIVAVRGTVRQVTEQMPAENNIGLNSYHRLVIQPSDGTQWPFFVYCLDLPDGFLKNEDPKIDVTATGYFFKNLSYRWQDGVGIAPVVLAKTVTVVARNADSNTPAIAARKPVAVDPWSGEESSETSKPRHSGPSLRETLALAGWDAERFSRFVDDQPVRDEEQNDLLELLWRVRSFDAASIERWSRSGVKIATAWENPAVNKGEMVRLSRNVISVQRHTLSDQVAARLELPAYYTCEMALEGSPYRAVVVTPSIPRDWLSSKELNEPASASAVFVKRIALAEAAPGDASPDASTMLFVAKRIAWHPRTADYPRVSLGKSKLGWLGVDVGLLDDVQGRGKIQAAEQEPFYQLLRAAGRIDAKQLVRAAQDNLQPTRERWTKELGISPPGTRRALAEEVIRRADEGRYSVAPFFNEPDEHLGELAVFDGVVRRAVRVDESTRQDGHASEVAHRFGFREYYEMEIYTDDSQNYPLVFCVRELPPGLSTGGTLDVPVRVAGFFFKDWLYTTRGTRNDDAREVASNTPRSQFAPLFIGRGPMLLQSGRPASHISQWVLGTAFVLALAGFWATAWWFARSDRQFAAHTRGTVCSLPDGRSLNDLIVPAENEPRNVTGNDDSNTSKSPWLE